MAILQTIGPLAVSVDETEVGFRFCDAMEMALEVPPFLVEGLQAFQAGHQDVLASRPVVFDLAGVPAISSRQLGVMLTVRQVVAGQGRLALRDVSESVKRLLKMTKMEQFFELL